MSGAWFRFRGSGSTSLISIIISPINLFYPKLLIQNSLLIIFPLTPEGKHNASQLFISFYFSNLFDQTKFLPFYFKQELSRSLFPSGIRGKN